MSDSIETQTMGGGRAEDREPITVGSKVGRYVIIKTLGTGGMGVVYAAYDPDLDRKVALKLLRYDAAGSAESRARMQREAQAMARLASPNVVAVYDVGSVRDQVYIAMELLGGTTLRRWLDEKRSYREVVEVMAAAGRGLADAHGKGLIHRDFKPDNVLVDLDSASLRDAARPGKAGAFAGKRVCVADFGVAAAVRGGAPRDSFVTIETPAPELEREMTAAGTLVGTPAYMSPEQLAGEQADARSDQYSFGVALYEALYGSRPFHDAKNANALAAAIAVGKIKPPPGPPLWLRAIMSRALSATPAARFPSMDALLAELARGMARRRRFAIAGAAAALLATSVAIAAFGRDLTTGAIEPCERAAQPADVELDAAALRAAFVAARPGSEPSADHVASRVGAWSAEVGELRGTACRAARVDGIESPQLFDLRMECAARAVRDVRTLVAAMRTPSPGLVDGAYEAIDRATDLSRCRGPRAVLASFAGPAVPALRDRLAAARTLDAEGKWEDAAKAAAAVAADAEAAGAREVAAEAWQLSGNARGSLLDHDGARDALRKALVASEATGDAQLRTTIYLDLERIEDMAANLDDVRQWSEQASALAEHADDPSLRWRVLLGRGRYEIDSHAPTCVKTMQAAIAAHRDVAAHEDFDDVTLLVRLADANDAMRAFPDALAAAKRAVDLTERLVGPTHPKIGPPLVALTLAQLYANQMTDALATARRAVAVAEATPGPASRLDDAQHALGLALMETHQNDEAEKVFAQALASKRETHSVAYAYWCVDRAYNLVELHRGAEALALAKRAVEIARHDSPGSVLANFLEAVARANVVLGDGTAAIAAYDEERSIYERLHDDHGIYAVELATADLLVDAHPADALAHAERALPLAKTDVEIANARVEVGAALARLHRDPARAAQLLHAARDTSSRLGDGDMVKTIDGLLAAAGMK